MCGALIQV